MTTLRVACLASLFAIASCGGAVDSASNVTPGSGAEGGSGGTVFTPVDEGLVVHEWGTYTSVHATDGHALGGVHHVDEPLPAWVHRRQLTPQSYNFEALPEEPKQQLETPVLYFHSAGVQDVHVEIGFPDGIVGEWFPDAAKFAPLLMQMKELVEGR